MALTAGDVIARFKSDLTDFKKGLSDAKSEVNSFAGKVGTSLKGAEDASKKFALALTAGTTALAGAIGYGAKVAGDLEAARQGFVALLGSAEKADATMARIKKEAAATPFELPGLVTGTQALTAITKDGNKAIDVLLDVGKAVAISGKGQAELDRVVFNLQQISATGKVTAMDIRQFQSAIPIFNDIVEASGMTVKELQESDNAAELLFEAFSKAGAEGGIAAAGFTAQAGTFNQLISNMKDNITILSSEIVKQTGIFDVLKGAIGRINDVLGNQDEIIPRIKAFLEFLQQWGPVIAGAIIGALVPAFVAWAGALWAVIAPLLPFIAIGAAVGLIIKGIIEVVQHWGDIMEWFRGMFQTASDAINAALTTVYEGYVKPILDAVAAAFTWLWESVIKPVIDQVVAYYKFWYDMLAWVWNNLVSPILYFIAAIFARIFYEIWNVIKMITEWIVNFLTSMWTAFWEWFKPYLEMLGKFVNDTWEWLKGVTQAAWNWIKEHIVKPFTEAKQKTDDTVSGIFNKITSIFDSLVGKVRDAWERIKNAIVEPFEAAKRKVEEIAQKIKEAADKINPFHRESPSLVDNVQRGVKAIKDAYSGLGAIQPPSVAGVGVGKGGDQVIVNLSGANITSPEIALEYAELIGDQLVRKLSRTVRHS